MIYWLRRSSPICLAQSSAIISLPDEISGLDPPKQGGSMKHGGVVIALVGLCLASAAQGQSVVEAQAKGSFEEIKQLLVIAIEGQGLVVDHVATVGEMLERTGQDLGVTTRIYERAEVLQFCSASYSRRMMEADARLLAFCPFGVGIYTLPGEVNTVHLVYRSMQAEGVGPEARETLAKIDAVLAEILQDAQ
jgi:uncharacterized protein (DUF302 family)